MSSGCPIGEDFSISYHLGIYDGSIVKDWVLFGKI